MDWAAVKVYSATHVHQALSVLLGNHIYPNFLEWPSKEKPAIDFTTIAPYQTEQIADYQVLPLPVNHSVPTVGYQVTSPEGGTVFYTGDTGPGLADCWERISPQLLITEVSAPDRFQELYQARGHLTPRLLKQELVGFRELKGYLPQVVIVHINPGLEPEIAAEIAGIARDLNHPVTLGREGMQINL
jgi:cAMP phosphodiesterase